MYKFPPYQFKDCYLIWDEALEEYRLIDVEEREGLMGLGVGHTKPCYAASVAKQSATKYEDERLSLIGDSFSVWSFAVIAAFSVAPWIGRPDVVQLGLRMGLPPGICTRRSLVCPLNREGLYGDSGNGTSSVQALNSFLACRTNHTGSDVKITTGELMNPKNAWRESVNATWWKWQPGFRVKWKFAEHINPLEMRGILLSIMWRARKGILAERRIFHLTDSYVSQSILAKGRTGSLLMRPLVRRVNAVLLASGSQLYIAHTDSSENPTDEAPRAD